MSSGSNSSAQAGLDVGRERLQNKNQYTYMGQTGEDAPLLDLAALIGDRVNQTRAEGNLAFGGPGYSGSFQSPNAQNSSGQGNSKTFDPSKGNGGTSMGGGNPGGQPPSPGPGNPPPGPCPGGPPPPPPPPTPPPGPGTGGPGTGGPAGISDAQLTELQKSIASARRLANGKVTWDDRMPKSYGVQPMPGNGVDEGEEIQTTIARLAQIKNGNLSPTGSGGPGYGGNGQPGGSGPPAAGPGPTTAPSTKRVKTWYRPTGDPNNPLITDGTEPVNYDPDDPSDPNRPPWANAS